MKKSNMIIEEHDKQIEYLTKIKEGIIEWVKKYQTLEGFKADKERAKDFVDSFNKEAKKQNSKWFAGWEEPISFIDKKPFILTHIHKRLVKGWWIFKNITTISLHIGCYDTHCSFVDNDYIISDYAKEKNDLIMKYLPEVRPILEKIQQVFWILPLSEIYNFEKRRAEIEKRIEKLEKNVQEVLSKT